MFVLVDGQPPDAAGLVAALRRARPGWRVEAVRYEPPVPPTVETRSVTARDFADWLTAEGSDWVVHLGPVPAYVGRRPKVAAYRSSTSSVGVDLVLTPDLDPSTLAGELVRGVEWHWRPVPSTPRVRRLAWVCPVPPAATGIADYGADVAAALAGRFDLEWVADPAGPAAGPAVARRYRVLTPDAAEARDRDRPFDLWVYHVGNSRFHTYMLPLLRRHPGLVVAHDVHLPALFRAAHGAGVWPGSVADELEYNGDGGHDGPCGRPVDRPAAAVLSPLNRRVFEAAPALVVHSGWAWQQVRRVTDAPVAVVPHVALPPTVASRTDERARLGLPADRFLVCTLGHVGPPKRVPALIRAVAGLPADVRGRTALLVVGPVHPLDREKLLTDAAALGIADRVEVRGRVPLEDFPAYAVAADVCVQLRYPSHGETSGALTRAMAAGATCVTSDMPTMAEVPNTVSLKVRSPLRDVDDLIGVLTRLARDPVAAARLGESARRYVAATHGPAVVAARYAAAIENAIAGRQAADAGWMDDRLNALADLPGGPPPGIVERWAAFRAKAARRAGAEQGRRAA